MGDLILDISVQNDVSSNSAPRNQKSSATLSEKNVATPKTGIIFLVLAVKTSGSTSYMIHYQQQAKKGCGIV